MAKFASRSGTRAARAAAVVIGTLALAHCGQSGRYGTGPTGGGGGGGGTGGTPGVNCGANCPSVTILQPALNGVPVGPGDSLLVQWRATSASGVTSIEVTGVAQRGNPALGTDTLVDRFTKRVFTLNRATDTTMARFIYALKTDSTSESAFVVVTAIDSAGNRGADTVTVRMAAGPHVSIIRPNSGAVASVGKVITIEIKANHPKGVKVVGWRTSGVLTRADSVLVPTSGNGVFPDTVDFIDTLRIPAATAIGAMVVNGFAVDSAGDPSATASGVTVSIASSASDVTPPLVTFTINNRVEVDDSVTVHATDASGISRIGFVVRVPGTNAVISADSLSFAGNQTDIITQFRLKLDTVSTFPRLITVEAFAIDSVGNRGLSSATGTPVPPGVANLDTVTVVAGKTFPLPNGGRIADAVYDSARNELYLSNFALNRLEVFQVSSSSFVAGGIPVGSRPWGLALWPRDTLGGYADTVIVANSGGTNLSIVDVRNRIERRRQRLPNYLIQKVKTVINPATNAIILNITEFDYSDRPQYVGAVCRNNCATVVAVYSTTPTQGQTTPDHGYTAWDILAGPVPGTFHEHFFWEPGGASAGLGTDTLQVIAVRDSVPGGALIRDTVLGAGAGVTADFNQLLFQDTTFVRNSGDFNHVLIGEGGGTNIGFERAFTFDARKGTGTVSGTCGALLGLALKCTGEYDFGISEGIQVRDLLGNRSARVSSIAINFNGRTNFVRADSIYVFDEFLRLTGLLQIGGQNPGMDVHPRNTFDAATRGSNGFGGNLNPNNRLLYVARPDPNIDAFDTYWYQPVTQVPIPVRDPIIGPIRLALNSVGQQVLVGVTQFGIVVIPLTTPINNPFPVRALVRSTR